MGRRVLLLNSDYNENSQLETILKKIGFDIMALGSEVNLADKVLGFRPDLVIAAGHSNLLSAVSVGMKLREMRGFSGSVILGFPKSVTLGPQEMLKVRLDRIQETPFDLYALIRNVCELLLLDAESHVEKLRKLTGAEMGEKDELRIIRGPSPRSTFAKTSSLASEARQARFQKALGQLDINESDTTFHRPEVRDKWAEVKKDWNFDMVEQLKHEKKQFTQALFEDVKAKKENQNTDGEASDKE